MKVSFTVNGRSHRAEIHPGERLLELLRRIGYPGVKNGCSNGDCGACAVLVDGRAVTSCLQFAAHLEGRAITTVEGLAGPEGLHPLQQAMLDTGGVQCGFCIPGILMTSVELLGANPDPTDEDIAVALAGNLCRCTGYVKQIEAVRLAAELLAGGGA